MQMIISIISDDFIQPLIDALLEKNIPVTEIASTGGFLKTGNTTIIMGVEEERLEEIDQIFKRTITAAKNEGQYGAHMFILNINEKIQY